MSEMIRVLLVEDQQLIQGALKNFLQQGGDIEVVAVADGGRLAIELALQHKPDVIVAAMALDIFHRAIRSLRNNGVQGFVSKNSAIEWSRAWLGGCPRIKNLLRKRPFGQIFRPFSLNRPVIRLKCTKNLTQNGVPSLRSLFSDSLLVFNS